MNAPFHPAAPSRRPDPAPDDNADIVVINQADGDVIVVKDHAGDDVAVEVSIRREGGREIIELDIVDIEECGRDNIPPPPAKAYRVRIDREPYVFEKRRVTGREILEKAGKTPVQRFELEKRVHGGRFIPVGPDDIVDLGEPGIEAFETFPLDETEG